jgi:hypothetical protein
MGRARHELLSCSRGIYVSTIKLQVVLAGRNLVQLATTRWCDSHLVDGGFTAHLVVADAEQTRCVGHPKEANPLPARRAADGLGKESDGGREALA